jgi:DNA-binding NarL/FixJ family response regulator
MRSVRALIVEDVAAMRFYIRAILESCGFECVEATDSLDARKFASEGGIDLIVTNIAKPRRNGLDLLKLTPRERVALAQIIKGASTKEAARNLNISPRTVEFHRANILRKLGVRNVAELIRKVIGGAGD